MNNLCMCICNNNVYVVTLTLYQLVYLNAESYLNKYSIHFLIQPGSIHEGVHRKADKYAFNLSEW